MSKEIIKQVKEELGLSYVPTEPMELAIKKERERIIGKIDWEIKDRKTMMKLTTGRIKEVFDKNSKKDFDIGFMKWIKNNYEDIQKDSVALWRMEELKEKVQEDAD